MNKTLRGMGLVMLGAVLSLVGCGGSVQEGQEGAPNDEAIETGNEASTGTSEPSPQWPEESGQVQQLGANCYVLCSKGDWRGPFTKVNWGACTEYGHYLCENLYLKYKACTWASKKP